MEAARLKVLSQKLNDLSQNRLPVVYSVRTHSGTAVLLPNIQKRRGQCETRASGSAQKIANSTKRKL